MTTTPPEPPGPGMPPGSDPNAGYGQPPGYGAPPGYGQPPAYGAPGGGMPSAPGQWVGPPLASWGERVLAALVDSVGPFIVAAFLFQVSTGLGALAYLAAFAWALYNSYLGGQTGQSTGKKMQGLRLLRESDGQPIGGGLGIARYFVHIVDGLPCYLGYLWPLWDAKKQTFADKILSTVVVKG